MSDYLLSRRKFLGMSNLGDGPSDPPIVINDANGNPIQMTVYGKGDGEYSAWAPELFINYDVGDQPHRMLNTGFTSPGIETFEPVVISKSPIEIVSQFASANPPDAIPKIELPPSIDTGAGFKQPGQPLQTVQPGQPLQTVQPGQPLQTVQPGQPLQSQGSASKSPVYYYTGDTPVPIAATSSEAETPSKIPLALLALFALLVS